MLFSGNVSIPQGLNDYSKDEQHNETKFNQNFKLTKILLVSHDTVITIIPYHLKFVKLIILITLSLSLH